VRGRALQAWLHQGGVCSPLRPAATWCALADPATSVHAGHIAIRTAQACRRREAGLRQPHTHASAHAPEGRGGCCGACCGAWGASASTLTRTRGRGVAWLLLLRLRGSSWWPRRRARAGLCCATPWIAATGRGWQPAATAGEESGCIASPRVEMVCLSRVPGVEAEEDASLQLMRGWGHPCSPRR